LRNQIIKTRRFYITATVFIFFMVMMVYPWNTSITVPAVFESQNKTTLFSPAPAYIENNFMVKGKRVEENEILMSLKSPELEHEIEITLQEIDILRLQAKRIAASSEELSNIQVIVQQLQESRSKLEGLYEKQNKFVIRAPVEGVIYDMEESLHVNRWVNTTLPLATIVQPEAPTIEGVISEANLSRIELQASAKFIPDNPQLNTIWGYVQDIELANLKVIDIPELASTYGGKVAAQYDSEQQLVPDKSVYRVRFSISAVEDVNVEQIIRGVVHIEGGAQSFIARLYKLVASVLVRESGF
jgi:putative peptide zinc metalloprotease protein